MHVEPCYEGEGLQELWKVNKGVGFTGVAAGGLDGDRERGARARVGRADPRREAGARARRRLPRRDACTALLMLDQFAVWCAEETSSAT